MTKDTLSETAALRALLSETSDTHMLAEMLGFVADRLMALDVDSWRWMSISSAVPARMSAATTV